jgi:MFS family permease
VTEEGGEARPGFRNAVRVLRRRNYRVYTLGNSVSLIGTWMQRVSVGWLAWTLTQSTIWLSVVAAAELLPTLALSPIAGALADRVDRVRLIRFTQIVAMVQAVALALLVYTGSITIELLVALTFALGAANAVNQPARLALVASLADRATLGSAVAINSLVFNSARFIGPAVAGLILREGGVALAFALNAVTYLPFILALTRLDVPAERFEGARRELIGDTVAGYAYALRHPGIGRMILLFAVTSFGIRGYIEMFPGFADLVFHGGSDVYSWLLTTLGLGATAGGLWMVRRPSIQGLTALIIGHSFVVAIAVLGFVATANYWVALACVFICGFALITTGISAQTLIQSAVDPAMRGRVLGLYGMLFRGGPAFNALLLGWLATEIGLRLSVALGALVCLAYWSWARLTQEAMERALEAEARGAAAE